ncbi:Uncharacterized protein FWK35_00036877 [Aphis craccivora]|uniref:Zinc finger BED domain-containing protein 1-like n=1 Tax=Aphis craccivora TaxID=307492 RepID=A0A6G0VI12_APHCR|nr:Uncharacterized protein FWK35_00036877 [Aphis craccivora]
MQHTNVWTSTNDETQTKLKRTSDSITKDTNEGLNSGKEKKSKVATILDFSRRSTLVSQKELNSMIQNLVINASLPFSLVEHEDFKKLVTVGYNGCRVLTRKTLMKNIMVQHENLIQTMKDAFSKVEYLTTTADCWSIFKRSYLGITCHWINPITLERVSCLLAIKRFKGSHTYDILAKTMESVYLYFNISDKVIYTTTDNGSNFVKSFQ